MRLARASLMSLVVILVCALGAPMASAQEPAIGEVDITFDVGEYDPARNDWTIDVVQVTGDLEEGQPFTVEIYGAGDEVLFSATQPYTSPATRIDVTATVAVGEVESAGVSQPLTVVAGVQVERPEVDWSTSGGGGSGQLALSMVMAVIIVAIVFRTPLPSASTQRWTK
ncbi:MAG: hypothetical protein ACRDYW_11140 [Acidimicrobiales bacterium]